VADIWREIEVACTLTADSTQQQEHVAEFWREKTGFWSSPIQRIFSLQFCANYRQNGRFKDAFSPPTAKQQQTHSMAAVQQSAASFDSNRRHNILSTIQHSDDDDGDGDADHDNGSM